MATQKTYSAKEAEERFETLPPEIKTYLYSPEMFAALKTIADKHHLHIDQLALLQAEVSSVMLGFTESQDFVPMLEENVRLEPEEAKLIAGEINEQILLKIREAMKGLSKNQPTPTAPPPAPAAPIAPTVSLKNVAAKPTAPHPADMMLSQKTATVAPAAPTVPAKPSTLPDTTKGAAQPYKADPYREIPE